MRKYINYILCTIAVAVSALSCSKMNSLHQPYLDEGEIIYAAKVDTAMSAGGKERIEITFKVGVQGVDIVRIFWNEFSDSIDVSVNGKLGMYSTIIENLDEDEYIFHLVSLDPFKNKSLKYELIGHSYGDRFAAGITNRGIEKMEVKAGILTISWISLPANSLVDHCIFTYKNAEGADVTVNVNSKETTLVITDFTAGSAYSYKTVYKPEVNAIDTFVSESRTGNLPAA